MTVANRIRQNFCHGLRRQGGPVPIKINDCIANLVDLARASSTPGASVFSVLLRAGINPCAVLLSLSLAACGATPTVHASHPEQITGSSASATILPAPQTEVPIAEADKPDSFELAGFWVGTVTRRLGSISVITLSLVEDEGRVRGFYKCSYGNQECRNQNDSGKVAAARMRGRRLELRIALPDLSSCIFHGAAVSSVSIRGGYSCYQGARLMEQGHFEITRRF